MRQTAPLLRGGTVAERGPRLHELDGLRGLAALTVFVTHVISTNHDLKAGLAWDFSPIGILWGAQAAVDLFFVLSGFVLALPFVASDRPLEFPRFYARFVFLRVFRIYPAFWFAITFSLAAMLVFNPAGTRETSSWVQSFWQHGPAGVPLSQIVRHFLMIVPFNYRLIDPPSWTLLIEMRMSLLVPLLIFAFRRYGDAYGTAAMLSAVVVAGLSSGLLHFLPMFALGVALARHWERAKSLARAALAHSWGRLLWIAALAAYGNEYLLGNPTISWPSHYLSAAGTAAVMVLAVCDSRASRFLTMAPVHFLGRISYSLYLLHFPIWLVCVSWLLPVTHSLLLTFLVAFPLVCLLSYVSFVAIEQPAIRFSRRTAPPLASPEPSAAV